MVVVDLIKESLGHLVALRRVSRGQAEIELLDEGCYVLFALHDNIFSNGAEGSV